MLTTCSVYIKYTDIHNIILVDLRYFKMLTTDKSCQKQYKTTGFSCTSHLPVFLVKVKQQADNTRHYSIRLSNAEVDIMSVNFTNTGTNINRNLLLNYYFKPLLFLSQRSTLI